MVLFEDVFDDICDLCWAVVSNLDLYPWTGTSSVCLYLLFMSLQTGAENQWGEVWRRGVPLPIGGYNTPYSKFSDRKMRILVDSLAILMNIQ